MKVRKKTLRIVNIVLLGDSVGGVTNDLGSSSQPEGYIVNNVSNISPGNGLLPDKQTIAWTNGDVSSVMSFDINLRAVLQERSKIKIT